MLNVRGRVPDDPLFYENIDDPSDLQPYVPYWERTADTIHVSVILFRSYCSKHNH